MLKATPTTTWSARVTTMIQPMPRPASPPATTAAAKPAPGAIAWPAHPAMNAPSSISPSTPMLSTPERLAISTASAPSRSGMLAVAAESMTVSTRAYSASAGWLMNRR